MAKVKVTYTVVVTQTIDWPDDEMEDFDHDNLMLNLDPSHLNSDAEIDDIYSVKVNGVEHHFD